MGIESPYPSGPALPTAPYGEKRTGPLLGAGSPIEPLRTGPVRPLRVADLAFRQTSVTGSPRLTFGARARNFCLPGLFLTFFEYDPVSVVVVFPTVFQPPLVLRWILTGTAAAQSVKAGSSVELTTPLAAPLFLILNVMLLACSLPVSGVQSGGGTRKVVVLNDRAVAERRSRPGSVRPRHPSGTITLSDVDVIDIGTVWVADLSGGVRAERTRHRRRWSASSMQVRPGDHHGRCPPMPHVGVNEVMVGAHPPAPVVARKVAVLLMPGSASAGLSTRRV